VISICYSLWLKNLAIIELGVVASGFFLRAYGGAVTSHITVSTWFLVVIFLWRTFPGGGETDQQMKKVGVKATRPVLAEYTLEFLRSALTLSATVVVTGYCLWAFDTSSDRPLSRLQRLRADSLTVVRSSSPSSSSWRSADAGDSAAPEDLLLHNRTVQALALIWVALLAWGVYG